MGVRKSRCKKANGTLNLPVQAPGSFRTNEVKSDTVHIAGKVRNAVYLFDLKNVGKGLFEKMVTLALTFHISFGKDN